MTSAPATVQERNIVDKAWDAQERLEARMTQLGRGKYARVIRMARKPSPEEYRKAALVSGVGILFIGACGFLLYFIMSFVPQ